MAPRNIPVRNGQALGGGGEVPVSLKEESMWEVGASRPLGEEGRNPVFAASSFPDPLFTARPSFLWKSFPPHRSFVLRKEERESGADGRTFDFLT